MARSTVGWTAKVQPGSSACAALATAKRVITIRRARRRVQPARDVKGHADGDLVGIARGQLAARGVAERLEQEGVERVHRRGNDGERAGGLDPAGVLQRVAAEGPEVRRHLDAV